MRIVDVHSYTDSPFKKAQPDTIKQISTIKSHHATTTLTLLSLSLSLSLIHGQMHTWHICIYTGAVHIQYLQIRLVHRRFLSPTVI